MIADGVLPSPLYIPESPPEATPLALYVQNELNRISGALDRNLGREFEWLRAEPQKPRDGMVRGADGTLWNPGGGQGVYCYYNGQWNRLIEVATAATIADGSVTTPKLADSAVTTIKLGSLSVTEEKLANLAVTLGKVAAGAVNESKIVDAAVTAVKLATNAVTSDKLVDGSVLTNKLADLAVTLQKLGTGAVDTSKLSDNAVTAIKIADGTITVAKHASGLRPVEIVGSLGAAGTQGRTVFLTTDNKLYRDTGTAWTAVVPTTDLTGQIIETQITDSAISTNKLAANAVTAAKIAANTITAGQIAAATITATEIATGAITATKIFAGAVGTDALAADSVIASKIAAAQIQTTHLAAQAVTAAKIAAGTITANEIAAGTILASNIAANTITGNEIAANAVGATAIAAGAVITAKLAAEAVTADKIATATITATQIAALTITGAKIAANTITADKISVSSLAAIHADLGAITAGTITLNTSGHIKSGQTAYDTGVGFWLGFDSTVAKLSLGSSSGSKVTWDGTTLTVSRLAVTHPTIEASGTSSGFTSPQLGNPDDGGGGASGNVAQFSRLIDTGVDYDSSWYTAASETYIANATIAGGTSSGGGLIGTTTAEIRVGDGLITSDPGNLVDNRVYILFIWNFSGIEPASRWIKITSIDWKLVRV